MSTRKAAVAVLCVTMAAIVCATRTRAQSTCTVSPATLDPGPFDRAGGPSVVRLTASSAACAWTLTVDVPWIRITGPTTGTGSAFVPFEVDPVPDGTTVYRVGVFHVGSGIANVTQNTSWLKGALESPTPPGVVIAPFTLSGWAVNDTGAGSAVDDVDASVRPANTTTYVPPTRIGIVTLGLSRDHVADRYGAAYRNTGWSVSVPSLAPGTYNLNVQAHATGGIYWFVSYSQFTVATPALNVNVSQVRAAVVLTGGSVSALTPPQPVILSGLGAAPWTATSFQPWIVVSNGSGTGDGRFTVTFDTSKVALPPGGVLGGTIRIAAQGVSGGTVDLPVYLTIYQAGNTARAFGAFESPADNATGLSGAIPITGWAIDDVGVTRVQIYRDPVAGEAQSSLVYIGDAPVVEGARPDVAQAYPVYPSSTSAGWGYMLLSNVLPAQGNGTFKFYAYAQDAEGQLKLLGARTVTIDNAKSTLPFGTLDMPAQGEVVSGVYTSRGWILTPQPAAIRPDGSLAAVVIDGQYVGRPIMGASRPDVGALFPGLVNTAASGGQYRIDTRLLKNGVHTIAWTVQDSLARAQGIGSRYFIVNNP